MEKKYTTINSEYLAKGLNFIGFRFFQYTDNDKTVYTFEETDEFLEALQKLMTLKQLYRQ